MEYVDGDPQQSSKPTKSRKPLALASIQLAPANERVDAYAATLQVLPHYRLPGLTQPLSLLLDLRIFG
jgi:predicted component of type VI protein secretion system